jgi:hypothetical protein
MFAKRRNKMRNKPRLNYYCLFAVFLFSSLAVFAQTGGTYKIEQSVIAGGGGTSSSSSGNIFSVTGTTGQSAAGVLSSGGTFSLEGGFWTAAANGGVGITISGQILFNSAPLQNVVVSLTGSSTQSTTDSSGNFLFTNLASGGSYTVVPAFSNYAFTPPSYTFTNATTNQMANFTAATCSSSISPNGTSAPVGGGTAYITVTAPSGCTWTASTTDDWITIESGTTGAGTGTVSYFVAQNTGTQRTGSIQVAGQNFLITQAGVVSSISGTVSYGTAPIGQSKFVSVVLMSAAGTPSGTASTNSFGAYLLENLTTNNNYTVTPSKTGNINGISPFDATLILRCVAAGPTNCTLTDNQKIAANTNGDNSISPFDATLILRFVAANAQTANTGQVGNWKFNPVSRNYTPLTGSLSNEHYEAILIGEVNGSWIAP